MKDPGVEEIRQARREISAECDHDLHEVVEYYRQVEGDPGGDFGLPGGFDLRILRRFEALQQRRRQIGAIAFW